MTTPFEGFVNAELPYRISTSTLTPTSGYVPVASGVGPGVNWVAASTLAPVQSVNGNTGAVTVIEGDSRSNRQGSVFWCEDFIGNYSRCEMLRQTGVSNVAELNGENVLAPGLSGSRGVMGFVPNATTWHITLSTLQTGAGSGYAGATKKTNLAGCSAVSQLSSISLAVLPVTSTVDQYELIGGYVITNAGTVDPSATEAFYWMLTVSGIVLVTVTGGATTTSAAVSLATAGITANTRLNIRLDWTPSNVKLYVNNVLRITNTTNIPQSTCGPLALAFKSGAGGQSAFATLWVYMDYFDQVFTVTTPRVLV